MKLNLPVTQVEHTYGDDVTLVSTTDAQGRITHCNAAFAELSGYPADELLGRAHNIVRHPDTPPELFAEMWATISAGRPWSGVVKNRCRNGDHYWVVANVTPVFEDGRIVAYMSVRHRPAAAQVAAAEALYAELARSREQEREAVPPRPVAPRPMHQRLTLELAAGLLAVVALAVLPRGLAPPAQAALVLAAAAGVLLWFQHRVAARVRGVSEAAARLAGCDLAARCDDERARSLGTLRHAIWLANLNMRAVVHDVRHEIRTIAGAADEIADGSRRLAALADQGIAYAVVASRIGALAHRSRSSAQQVRQLVSACSEHVAEGSRRAGAAQADVLAAVEAVGCVADRLREIATATDEQARGVAEATRAMARIDEAACSNAALAEQSTGAGQALQARAATLARAVAVFRVGG
ncbi:aerotaxis receptor [Rubrivivax gelatinosus]|uniref:methyl-accepting chemotaxis protein n=2 Tax=Rubrivivax gelatinosus TaxID=28068 RepID=UPI0018C98367|nr:PAS domain-containing methyl-accepting chemotaxis protein [Rubrivivax gelatinosus]MBG6082924.1 aerotaxis receptor [Rubrivivax gelatinosus]